MKKRLAEAESSIESVNKNVQNLLSMSTKRGKSTWHDRGTLDTRAHRALTGCIRSAKTGDNLYVISLGSDDLYCYHSARSWSSPRVKSTVQQMEATMKTVI